MRQIGLHLRLMDSFEELVQKALQFNLTIFQCFFISKQTGYRLHMDDREIEAFLKIRHTKFTDLYVHVPYWVNLSNPVCDGMDILKKELALAKKLAFNYLVLHPGSCHESIKDRLEGVDVLAKNLNSLLRKEKSLIILLENTAHGNHSIGSNIEDFILLRSKLDYPEKVAFCVDTAHAYSFGYDITSTQGLNDFMQLLDSALGFGNIKLIHLNDTQEKLGSKVDKHYIVGQGNIGAEALQRFIDQPVFKQTPIILELPVMADEEEKEILTTVRQWQK